MPTFVRKLIGSFGLFALLALPIPALAQQPAAGSPRHEGIGIGVKAGPLFSNLDLKNNDGTFKNRTGFIGGLFLGGNRPGVVGVGVDILFARKGAKIEGTDLKVNMDYINVPVYARINVGSSTLSGASVYGIVGLDLNFLLKSEISNGEKLTDDFQRADYGIVVGLGVEITRFIVEGRYAKGLGNIAKDKNDPDENLKSHSFAIMFGVRFN